MDTCRKPIFTSLPKIFCWGIFFLTLTACATRRYTDPLSAADRLNLGLAYEQRGDWEQALIEYQRAERGDMTATARTYAGNLHLNRKAYEPAERAYRSALRADPNHIMALNNLAWLLAETDGDLQEAESLALQALDQQPDPKDPIENTLRIIREKRSIPQ